MSLACCKFRNRCYRPFSPTFTLVSMSDFCHFFSPIPLLFLLSLFWFGCGTRRTALRLGLSIGLFTAPCHRHRFVLCFTFRIDVFPCSLFRPPLQAPSHITGRSWLAQEKALPFFCRSGLRPVPSSFECSFFSTFFSVRFFPEPLSPLFHPGQVRE